MDPLIDHVVGPLLGNKRALISVRGERWIAVPRDPYAVLAGDVAIQSCHCSKRSAHFYQRVKKNTEQKKVQLQTWFGVLPTARK